MNRNNNEYRYPWATGIGFGVFFASAISIIVWKLSGSIETGLVVGVFAGVWTGIITWNNESN